jgi:Contact-dependent growth inhibition CdiA C-terminal domain
MARAYQRRLERYAREQALASERVIASLQGRADEPAEHLRGLARDNAAGYRKIEAAAVEKRGRLIIDSTEHSVAEIRAAKAVRDHGHEVVLRDPLGTRAGGRTSDLLVDGVPYDIYTPKTNNADRIISAIAKKNSQARGIVLDLSHSNVSLEELGNVLERVRGAGAARLEDIIVVGR